MDVIKKVSYIWDYVLEPRTSVPTKFDEW